MAGTRIAAALIALGLVLAGCTAGPAADSQGSVEPPIELSALLTADVPALCDHPAGTLVDGVLPVIDETMGGTFLDSATIGAIHAGDVPEYVAFHPGETAAVASLVRCYMGGVGWPDNIVFWDENMSLLGGDSLSEFTGGIREGLTGLRAADEGYTAEWLSAGEQDLDCCGTASASANVYWKDGAIAMRDLTLRHGEEQVMQLDELVNSGAAVADGVAAASAVSALQRLGDLGHEVDPASVECDGTALGPLAYAGYEFAGTTNVTCAGVLDSGEIVVFAMEYSGWNAYRVLSAFVS